MPRDSIVVEPLRTEQPQVAVLPASPTGIAPGTPPQLGAPQPAVTPPVPGSVQALVIPNDESIDATYRGKTALEIIEMHKNATQKIGEQGAEMDTWRRLVSDLSQQQINGPVTVAQPETPSEVPLELSGDDLLRNPVEAIASVVDRSLKTALGPIEVQLANSARLAESQRLTTDYPELHQLGSDEGFKTWAVATPGRQQDAVLAGQGDPNAARRLMEAWSDRQELIETLKSQQTADNVDDPTAPVVPVQPLMQGLDGARLATVPAGGAGPGPITPTLSAEEILDTIIKDPELYRSAAYQEKVQQAAQAGSIAPKGATHIRR